MIFFNEVLFTVALDIFIKEKNNTFIFLGFLLCHCSMQKVKLTWSKGTLLTIIRPSRIFQPPPPPLNRSFGTLDYFKTKCNVHNSNIRYGFSRVQIPFYFGTFYSIERDIFGCMLPKQKRRNAKAKTIHESWSGQTIQDFK